MKNKFNFIFISIIYISIILSGITDPNIINEPETSFNSENSDDYIIVNRISAFGDGASILTVNCFAKNISNFDLANINIIIITSEGNQSYSISQIAQGQKVDFEIIISIDQPIYDFSPNILDFIVTGDIIR